MLSRLSPRAPKAGVLLGSLSLWTVLAGAPPVASARSFQLTPSLDLDEAYDDNVLLLQRGQFAGAPPASWTHTAVPALALFLPLPGADFRLQYRALLFAYSNETAVRSGGGTSSGMYNDLDATLSFYPVREALLYVKDHYTPTPLYPWQAPNSFQDVEALNLLNPGILFDHPLGRRGRISLGYDYAWGQYVGASPSLGLSNWAAHHAQASYAYTVWGPLAVVAEYRYDLQHFFLPHPYAPPPSDVITQSIRGGIEAHVGKVLDLKLLGGADFFHYMPGGPSLQATDFGGSLDLKLQRRWGIQGGPTFRRTFDVLGREYRESGGHLDLSYTVARMKLSAGAGDIWYSAATFQEEPVQSLVANVRAEYNLSRHVMIGVGARWFRRWVKDPRAPIPPPPIRTMSDELYDLSLRAAL